MASTLLSIQQIRDALETGLPDTALEVLVDEADQQITSRYGPHSGEVIETTTPHLDLVFLGRQSASISEVRQFELYELPAAGEEVAASSYRVLNNGWVLSRPLLWRPQVQVTFTPADTSGLRKGVLLDLVRLALAYDAYASSSVGNVQVRNLNRRRETGNILSRLNSTISMVR